MPKLEKRKTTHGTFERATFNFEVPGETILAVHNALAFTMAHHDQYAQESKECDHCFEAMYAMRRQLAQLIENATVYQKLFKKTLN